MTTIDDNEVAKFSKIADEWWDYNGKFKPLHKFNPIRLNFIKNEICDFYHLDKNLLTPFKNINSENINSASLKILDVGCGGGLVAEPICRLGADLTAIDASEKNIKIAKIHAEKSNLNIDYQALSVEELVAKNNIQSDPNADRFANKFANGFANGFDIILALEIIEHVADVDEFIKSCSQLLKPNGLIFIATLNRTAKSLLMAKFGVEYILRWLPIGTHDWRKFLKPSEIEKSARSYDLQLQKIQGFSYNLLKDEWSLSNDLDINYCLVFKSL